jgi:hypothetical protein
MTMKKLPIILAFLGTLSCITNAAAQDAPKGRFYHMLDSINNTRKGQKINLKGTYQTIDGKPINFNYLETGAFIYFGFYGCQPCRVELPVFMDMAVQHPNVYFVYITFDSKETIKNEVEEMTGKAFKPAKNLYILSITREKLDATGLTAGYPTKYWIDRSETIQAYEFMGLNVGTNEVRDIWGKRVKDLEP